MFLQRGLVEMDDEHDWGQSRADMLKALEYGSCDDCGRHNWCPVCGASKDGAIGHNEDCPVPQWIRKINAK